MLASRLTERSGLRVLLLEAGGEPDDPRIADPASWPLLQGSAVDWAFTTVPQPAMAGRAHPWPRGKVVGGSSAIHAMGHMRGHPDDFEAWVRAGAEGWGWDDLLPYFVRSETSPFAGEPGYGGAGPVMLVQPARPHPLTEAHRAAGQERGLAPRRDHNGPGGMDGPTLNTLTLAGGRRQSVADAYLTSEVRSRSGLELRTGILVDRLYLGADGRASGVEVVREGRVETIGARLGVILAAGSIGSPSILMRSGLGPAAVLRAAGVTPRCDMAGVGANLQDHLLSAGNLYRASRPVPPSETQHSESLTYIHAAGQASGEAPELVVGCVTAPIVSEALSPRLSRLPAPGEAYTLMFGITHPRSRGRLTIRSAAPEAPPEIDPAYLSAARDRAHFLEALEWARRLGSARAYAGWRDAELLPEHADLVDEQARLAFIEAAAFTHHHPVGTCRMGRDAGAVTAPDLSVAGVPGLFICDGSILPSLTTGPVNAAIVAVAERAADLLGARARAGGPPRAPAASA